jgi:hypothetical protein
VQGGNTNCEWGFLSGLLIRFFWFFLKHPANATLIFWKTRSDGAATLKSEIGVLAASGGRGYYAVLTVQKGSRRSWSVAAQGQNSDTAVGALRSLLDVTTAALAKNRGRVLRSPSNLSRIGGGLVDEEGLNGGKEESSGGVRPWVSLVGLSVGCFVIYQMVFGQSGGRRGGW